MFFVVKLVYYLLHPHPHPRVCNFISNAGKLDPESKSKACHQYFVYFAVQGIH